MILGRKFPFVLLQSGCACGTAFFLPRPLRAGLPAFVSNHVEVFSPFIYSAADGNHKTYIEEETLMSTAGRRPRLRFAPSPTGFAHIGSARTALYNYLLAKSMGGDFILRIEDTDRTRYVEGSVEDIIASFKALGIEWSEGPDIGGPYGPYYQSQRQEIYHKYLHQLVEEGKAYPCFCSAERLKALREEQEAKGVPPGYDRKCRDIPLEEAKKRMEAGEPYVIRFKMPLTGTTVVHDILRGTLTFDNSTLDDHVLLKQRVKGEQYAWPTYHGASPMDDHFMEITHIVRGDEWLPSTPKHVLLYEAFGWEVPQYAHLPVILSPTGKGKMSKRDGMTAVRDFLKEGYLPEALFNFLLFLGWNSGTEKEIYSKEEAIRDFSFEGLSKSPAAFNIEKLRWYNGVYIRSLPREELARRVLPYLEEAGFVSANPGHAEWDYLMSVIPLIQERITVLSEVPEQIDFLYRDVVDYDPALLVPKKGTKGQTLAVLRRVEEIAREADPFSHEQLANSYTALAEEMGLKKADVFMPIRVAVSGRTVSPGGSTEIMEVLGREKSLERIRGAIGKLENL